MIRIATLVAPALLAGCVSVQQIPLTATTGGALRDREVSLAVRDKPDFAAMTPGKAAIGGLIGAALMIEAGNQIIKEHSVEDPASQIAEAVRAGLNESYRARSSSKTVRIASDDVAQTSRDNAALDLLLDVRTIKETLKKRRTVVPAKAGTHASKKKNWTPAFAGATSSDLP